MTVSTTTNVVSYVGNGATVTFSFNFPAVAASDLIVSTTTSGVTTIVSTSLYTVILNAPAAPNPTGAGGSVTFNTPPANGTEVTITRQLPLTQTTSFANQGTLYQPTIEQTFDYTTMLVQQFGYQVSLAIQGPITDPAGLVYTLPAASVRALQYVAFDSNGNVITTQGTTSTNPVSSAMTPVVSAATLALGRTAFGLGNVAVESIGAGLADNGSGALQVVFTPVADSVGQSVTSSFHLTQRFASGALTYALPRANTLFAGFGFFVTALTGVLTFTINAADKFVGAATGVSMTIPPGTYAYITTDAATNGNWYIQLNSLPGFTEPLNAWLGATVSSNALTINLFDRNGNVPSTASPVFIPFRDITLADGDASTFYFVVTSALSIVVPSTATLGTVSGQANRIWVGIFNNAGSLVLGVYNSLNSTGPSIASWDESIPANGTAIIAGSNSAQTWYTNGAVTAKPYRILGYVESTQATAGTWATAPSKLQMFGPGIKKPGDQVQMQFVNSSTGGAVANAAYTTLTGPTLAITPQSAANMIIAATSGPVSAQAAAQTFTMQMLRGATPVGQQNAVLVPSTGTTQISLTVYDIPNTTSSVTYGLQAKNSAGGASNCTYVASGANATYQLTEIQI